MRSATARTSTSPASWSISRRPASIPATAPARCRRTRCPSTVIAEIRRQTEAMAKALNVVGLMNVQFAVKDDEIYVLEVNPRASRTVPFVAKATGLPIAKIAARVMAGEQVARLQPRTPPMRAPCRGQGSGLPLRPLPRRRHHPRAGDEVDRRGDGPRPRLRPRLRQGPARRRRSAAAAPAPSSSRSRTSDKAAHGRRPRAAARDGLRHRGDPGTAPAFGEAGIPVSARQQGAGGPTAHRRRHARTATSSWCSTRPTARRRSPTASACAAPR